MRAALAPMLLLAAVLAGCIDPGVGGTTPLPVDPPGTVDPPPKAPPRKDPPRDPPPSPPPKGPQAWPQFPLDVAGTRHQAGERTVTAAAAPTLQVLWSVPVGGAVTGTPVVADGKVVFGAWDKQVRAVDARTGKLLWNATLEGQVDGTPALVGGHVYVGDGKGWLTKLDADDGREVWRAQLDPEPGTHLYSSPLVHGGKVYLGIASDQHSVRLYPEPQPLTFRGSVVAVDAATGNVTWRWWVQPPDGEGLGGSVWGSPVLDAASMTLFVGTGNAYTAPAGNRTDALVALDARTGAERWAFQATKDDVWTQRKPNAPDWDFGASPVLAQGDGKLLVIAPQKSGVVWARDAATGDPVWRHGTPKGGQDITASPAVMGGRVFVATQSQGLVRAFDAADGTLLWERDLGAALYSSPAALPGLVLVGTSDGHLVGLDPASGEELARLPTGRGGIFGGVSVANGLVYTGTTPRGFVGPEGHLLAWGLR